MAAEERAESLSLGMLYGLAVFAWVPLQTLDEMATVRHLPLATNPALYLFLCRRATFTNTVHTRAAARSHTSIDIQARFRC